MPNGDLSELVQQELEKRKGNYADLEAGLRGRGGGPPQKSPRRDKPGLFEPADAKGPLRNPLVRNCCGFCMSPALRWIVIIVGLIGTVYAYGIAVDNGWAQQPNVQNNKHVQMVMQKTSEIVNQMKGTTPPVEDTSHENANDSQTDVARVEEDPQVESTPSDVNPVVVKADDSKENIAQDVTPEKGEEDADGHTSSRTSEVNVVHHEPVEGLKKLVKVEREDSGKPQSSSAGPKSSQTTPEANQEPVQDESESSTSDEITNPGALEEGKVSKDAKVTDEKQSKTKAAKTKKHPNVSGQGSKVVETLVDVEMKDSENSKSSSAGPKSSQTTPEATQELVQDVSESSTSGKITNSGALDEEKVSKGTKVTDEEKSKTKAATTKKHPNASSEVSKVLDSLVDVKVKDSENSKSSSAGPKSSHTTPEATQQLVQDESESSTSGKITNSGALDEEKVSKGTKVTDEEKAKTKAVATKKHPNASSEVSKVLDSLVDVKVKNSKKAKGPSAGSQAPVTTPKATNAIEPAEEPLSSDKTSNLDALNKGKNSTGAKVNDEEDPKTKAATSKEHSSAVGLDVEGVEKVGEKKKAKETGLKESGMKKNTESTAKGNSQDGEDAEPDVEDDSNTMKTGAQSDAEETTGTESTSHRPKKPIDTRKPGASYG